VLVAVLNGWTAVALSHCTSLLHVAARWFLGFGPAGAHPPLASVRLSLYRGDRGVLFCSRRLTTALAIVAAEPGARR